MTQSHRFSIAGLMGVVLTTSLGLTALRSGSATWAAAVFLLACGILALGLVGVACCGGTGRAWWLGFALFGWGYLALAFWSENEFPRPPTAVLLDALRQYLGPPVSKHLIFGGLGYGDGAYAYGRVAHGLGSLIAATFGGLLAHLLFATPSARSARTSADPQPTGRSPVRWRRRPAILVLASAVVFPSAALMGARVAPGLWAGLTVLLTWGLLGLAALGAVFSRRSRRARWLGATLFGVGYLLLVSGRSHEQAWPQFATNRLLNAFRPWLPSVAREHPVSDDATAQANARVLKMLDRTVPMRFPKETPLEDVLTYIVAKTRGPDGREIPIYIEPGGLHEEVVKTMSPSVSLVLDGVPLRTTLRLLLRQLGMTYSVRDGLIIITGETSSPDASWPANEDPFLLIGQCLLALLAAGLGGILAPLIYDPQSEQAD